MIVNPFLFLKIKNDPLKMFCLLAQSVFVGQPPVHHLFYSPHRPHGWLELVEGGNGRSVSSARRWSGGFRKENSRTKSHHHHHFSSMAPMTIIGFSLSSQASLLCTFNAIRFRKWVISRRHEFYLLPARCFPPHIPHPRNCPSTGLWWLWASSYYFENSHFAISSTTFWYK